MKTLIKLFVLVAFLHNGFECSSTPKRSFLENLKNNFQSGFDSMKGAIGMNHAKRVQESNSMTNEQSGLTDTITEAIADLTLDFSKSLVLKFLRQRSSLKRAVSIDPQSAVFEFEQWARSSGDVEGQYVRSLTKLGIRNVLTKKLKEIAIQTGKDLLDGFLAQQRSIEERDWTPIEEEFLEWEEEKRAFVPYNPYAANTGSLKENSKATQEKLPLEKINNALQYEQQKSKPTQVVDKVKTYQYRPAKPVFKPAKPIFKSPQTWTNPKPENYKSPQTWTNPKPDNKPVAGNPISHAENSVSSFVPYNPYEKRVISEKKWWSPLEEEFLSWSEEKRGAAQSWTDQFSMPGIDKKEEMYIERKGIPLQPSELNIQKKDIPQEAEQPSEFENIQKKGIPQEQPNEYPIYHGNTIKEFEEWIDETNQDELNTNTENVQSKVAEADSMVEPVSQNSYNSNEVTYELKELEALKNEKKTPVSNEILKLLINDYRRLKNIEEAYKAGKMGFKSLKQNFH